MRKRNRLIAVLLVSAMTMALSACGGSAEGESKGESKGDGTLTVAIWDVGQQPGLEEIMADFTEKLELRRASRLSSGTAIGRFWRRERQVERCQTYSGCIPMRLTGTCLTTFCSI